jgi:membrane-associated phospholipid phosphatase/4-amino-4-deoxy-L-arabinose transferase-like glycosyltransferase
MHWLQTIDLETFRLFNLELSNRFFDSVMPWLSGNGLFVPLLFAAGMGFLWKGRLRGVLCVLLLALVVSTCDGLLCNTLKHAISRPRPFLEVADARCLVGRGGSGSMPSSHAANWFAATMVMLVFYRRSLWFMLPAAALVSFSRIYNGVHYPSDVLAGALLGAGYAVAALWLLQTLWARVGRAWFPLWWAKVPSLLNPPRIGEADEEEPMYAPRRAKVSGGSAGCPASEPQQAAPHASLDQHWLRLGYLCIAVFLLARWVYIGSGTIQLAEDEAYQWLWSKHLALSYFSKPPLIAYTQFLGTSLWGDTAFGVRFFSPLLTALMSVVVLRFFAREVNARAGFFLLLIVSAAPLLSVGAVLMTVDPLSVLFWTAAMLAGWRAVQEKATTRDWLWVGLWMGLGFLSKYTQLFQLLCWAVFMVLWPAARRQLRRPGPYLALLVNLLCALPVLIWNAQHAWVTVSSSLAVDAAVGQPWRRTFIGDFLGTEAGLLNPVFFVAMVWACIAFWRSGRHNPLLVYFFSMGAPLFLAYMLHSLHARVLPNWIAPSVLPLFCVMVIYWDTRLRLGVSRVKTWLGIGLAFGFVAVLFFHATELWSRSFGLRQAVGTALRVPAETKWGQLLTERYLPVNMDPLHRVRNWSQTAQAVEGTRQVLLAEGKPVFIIADHYGFTGQFSFYLPEARADVREHPLVFCRSSEFPENQFYFWPGYESRKGQNAIYVRELDRDHPVAQPPPERLESEFESVTDMGVTNVLYHDQFLLRPLQIFACRSLR